MTARLDRATLTGLGLTLISAVIYWISNRDFEAGHPDFFYLADAFLHGRVWLDFATGPWDVIIQGSKVFVPFAPFPAIAFMPLVAIIGPVTADHFETGINAILAAGAFGMGWWLLGRLNVRSLVDRFWLVLLLGFSTVIWWITTRGGVWHTGQLIATLLTLGALIELSGKRRAWLIGLLAGAGFLSRAPLAFAVPFYALLLAGDTVWEPRRWPWATWAKLALGVVPSVAFFFWYNAARFGSPLESGYALATVPPFLEAQRELGLFSILHIPMNLNYLLIRPLLPNIVNGQLEFPFLRPSGLGMSIFLTSPGLLYALRAPRRESRTWWLAGAALAVLIPTLLYYGGGWLQFGYRYALDSIPFVWALCGMAAASDAARNEFVGIRGPAIGVGWRWLIVFGVLVGLLGWYWAYHL